MTDLHQEPILSVLPDIKQAQVPQNAVTARALVVGSILVVLSDLYINWALLVLRASKLNKSYYPMGLFFLFAVLAMVNRWCGRRGGLSRPEMLLCLGMGLIGPFFPFFGLAGFLVGVVASPYYFATSENGWSEVLHPHIPSWIALTDEDLAATWFYEGIPGGTSIPWSSWAVPMAWWTVLVAAMAWSILCLSVLFRKQWVEYERRISSDDGWDSDDRARNPCRDTGLQDRPGSRVCRRRVERPYLFPSDPTRDSDCPDKWQLAALDAWGAYLLGADQHLYPGIRLLCAGRSAPEFLAVLCPDGYRSVGFRSSWGWRFGRSGGHRGGSITELRHSVRAFLRQFLLRTGPSDSSDSEGGRSQR